jgi:hypothetical protein
LAGVASLVYYYYGEREKEGVERKRERGGGIQSE